jgi:DNA-binding MarR family transcriptional regulator
MNQPAAHYEPALDADAARAMQVAMELRVLIGKLNRRLREQAGTQDLSSSQKSVLIRLERDGPQTVTSLAKAEGVRPQSMGATIAMLQGAALVSGTPDPADKRQTILSLTPACREWMAKARAARQDWLFGAIRSKLEADEVQQLANGVELLKRLVDS